MRTCEFCGGDYDDTARECPLCGAPLRSETTTADPASTEKSFVSALPVTAIRRVAAWVKSWPRLAQLLTPVIGLLVLLVVVLVLAFGGDDPLSRQTVLQAVERDGEICFLADGRQLRGTVEGDSCTLQTTWDGRIAAVRVRVGSRTALYRLTDSGAELLCDDVYQGIAVIAPYSGDIAYVKTVGEEQQVVRQAAEGGEVLVASGTPYTFDIANTPLLLSPDGGTAACVMEEESGYVLHVYTEEGGTAVSEDCLPLAVSDGGAYVYAYHTPSGRTVVWKDGELCTLAEGGRVSLWSNRDGSEVLLARDGGLYVSEDGGEPRRLVNKSVGGQPLLLPDGMAADGVVLPIASFEKELLQTEEAVYRVEDGEALKVTGGGNFFLSKDGKTLVYVKEGRLYRGAPEDTAEAVRLADGVRQVRCSADGKIIFFLNDDDVLYAVEGDDAPIQVASDVEKLAVTAKGDAFFTIDGALFSCTDGKTYKQVRDVKGEVASLSCTKNAVLVYNTDDAVYASTGNTRFREVK